MKKFYFLFFAVAILFSTFYFLFSSASVFAQSNIDIFAPPGSNPPTSNLGDYINALYKFALLVGGIMAFGAVVYGGVKYIFAAGNPTGQSEGKDWIKSALLGLFLLAGAYLVLHTINPDIVGLNLPSLSSFTLPPPPPNNGGGPPGGGPAACNNPQQLAQQNNEPYPAKRSTAIQNLMTCIQSKTGYPLPAEGGSNAFYGSVFTYDHSYPLCNYTRGQRTCSDCSHMAGSCHYGGASGSDGALAVDFGNQANIGIFQNAAVECGTTAEHVIFEGDHVHISAPSCSGN